jgi:NAD(P)-dependent dehydrogenase (short-subunit alcohol dehydrogenase family)
VSAPGRDRPLTLVTGAARGIGRAIAIALAEAGHDLVLVDRDGTEAIANDARARAAECVERRCDITDEAAVAALFEGLGPLRSRLSGLVNNAGFTGERMTLADAPAALIDQVFAVNVRGLMLMCRAAIPLMQVRGGGAIVNLSSQSATFGGAGLTPYAASKAAVNGLTVSLAREIAPAIRVNAISPGPVLTEPLRALPPERLAEMERSLPMGRFLLAQEVAAVAVWLLSDAASYVSGAIVPVHGAR